ncbi:glycosyltransferase family 10 domain-containing protein [Helicobacter sp. 23-1045]
MQIKMKVIDWWDADTEENFYKNHIIKILRQKFDIVRSDDPDFVLCGPFGNRHFEYECVKIFYTGENVRVDWNLMDYGIGFDYMDFGDRYLHFPLFAFYQDGKKERVLGKREKFCSYLVRHSGAFLWGEFGGFRDRFFDKLSEYKRVDSGGNWRNNIGGSIDSNGKSWMENKQKWLQSYKFNICFENSSAPGYLTEKLFDAYNAGCIPIYWGDTSLRSAESNAIFAESSKKNALRGGGNS